MTGRIRITACVIIMVLSAFAIGRSQGRTKSFFNNDKESDYSSLEITQDMWEQIQCDCGLDVTQMTGTVESSGLHLDGNMFKGSKAMNAEASTVTKVNLQHVVAVLPLHLKQTLLSCLQMESIPVRVFEEENGSSSWFIRYLDSIFSWSDALRRNLGQKHLQGSTLISAPGHPLAPVLGEEPLLGSTSIFAPAFPPASFLGEKLFQGSPVSAPAYPPAPVQDVQSPAYAPEPSSGYTPVSFDEYSDGLSAEIPVTPFLPDIYSSEKPSASEQPSASPNSAPPLASNKHHIHVPVVVGATATGTFVFALVLLCFYQKRYVVYPGYGDKDKALPSLSLGSSRKSALRGTLDKEQFVSQLCDTNANQNGKSSSATHNFPMATHVSSLDHAQSFGETFGAGRSLVESSAVSADNAAPLLPSPSLKPPPGRDKPLSSGAPAAPPITAGCSPGPPPPPPPPPPVPSGSLSGPPPPIPTSSLRGPPPPPPPKGAGPPRPPQAFPLKSKSSPIRMNQPGNTACDERSSAKAGSEASKSKLKPFFWDTVQASPDQSMVWHQISSGSFQFDEDMIENLFGCTAASKNKKFQKKGFSSKDPSHQYIQILDSKKAQNISILLRALNVTTEEVRDALYEGNTLPSELLQTLLKMAPTSQEELKLRLFNGEVSQLGPADRFLKFLVDMPFAFKRLDSLLYKSSVQEEISSIKESLATLEVASRELRSSRLFLKLLEAVLKTGNRMNDGTFRGGAQAFKLDTLLKLADVRGTDGKTTLLHFVVQEIIRSEGRRAARGVSESQLPSVNPQDVVDDSSQETEDYYCSLGLQVVSGLGAELGNVRKAAGLDAEGITSTVSKLGHGLLRTRNFLNTDLKSTEEDSEFHRMLKRFVEDTEVEITKLLEEEKRVMSLVKSSVDYFHGNAGKDEGLRLFVVVRDFLFLLEKTCKEVEKSIKMVGRVHAKRVQQKAVAPPSDANKSPSPDIRQLRFPRVAERRRDGSTSDDETSP